MKLPPFINRTTLGLSAVGITSIAGIAAGASGPSEVRTPDPFSGPESVALPLSMEEKPKPKAKAEGGGVKLKTFSMLRGEAKKAYEKKLADERARAAAAKDALKTKLYSHERDDLWPEPTPSNYFGLDTYACTKVLFGNAPLPDNTKEAQITEVGSGDLNSELINAKPKPEWSKNTTLEHGCVLMHMRTGGGKLTFRSEFVMKNENMGFAMWVAVRDDESNREEGKLRLKINYRIAMYEHKKDEKQWSIHSAYGWTLNTFTKLPNIKHVEVRMPHMRHEYHRVSTQDVAADKVKTIRFGGLLTARWNSTGNYTNLHVDELAQLHTPDASPDMWVFDPTSIKGQYYADTFYYDMNSQPGRKWEWKRLRRNSVEVQRSASDAIKAWTDPFKHYRPWVNMSDYCPTAKEKKEDPTHMVNVCFTDTVPRT